MGVTRFLAAGACLAACLSGPVAPAAGAPGGRALPSGRTAPILAPSPIRGAGSTYVGPAMTQWKGDAQQIGLDITYTPIGSPRGLGQYRDGLSDFAATEAEFSSLPGYGVETSVGRSFQYIPDVAGAIAVMYNVSDLAGAPVDNLRLSRRTIARIFLGDIARWSDPAITADNDGLQLPDEPITIVYRGGQSGTTALFYDFVANMAPDLFGPWAQRNGFDPRVRIIDLESQGGRWAPSTTARQDSDLMARAVAETPWTISYDEFAYALIHGADAAWVDNASGRWIRPYARNISAALESAQLRPDLSQELSGVYTSPHPGAYPISAYSYIVGQCAPRGDRPTCTGGYDDGGKAETLSIWLRYIACEGQVEMANIGYSPLPPNLSQEMANSIARMNGTEPEQLGPGNCANPRFHGDNWAPDAPEAPPVFANQQAGAGNQGNRTSGSNTTGQTAGQAAGTQDTTAGAGRAGETEAVGGGSDDWRPVSPVAYNKPGLPAIALWALVVLVALLVVPLLVGGGVSFARRNRAFAEPPPAAEPDPGPDDPGTRGPPGDGERQRPAPVGQTPAAPADSAARASATEPW